MGKNIYMVTPVRLANDDERAAMLAYAQQLEAEGHTVHLPHRDVDQRNDDGGTRICRRHRVAMAQANEVHIWVRPDGTISEGEHFDAGMAYMMALLREEPVTFRLCGHLLSPTEHKSFTNVLLKLVHE